MKLIDGHDVIEHAEVNGESREFIRILMDYIEDADAVEPKQGEWERIPYSMADYGRRCSLCHFKVGNPTNYCPNCGCRMKGVGDD